MAPALAKKSSRANRSSTAWARGFIFLGILFLLLLAVQWWRNRQTRFVRYNEFGIDIPVNYSIHGIDVSRHNGTIDWKEVQEMNIRGISIRFAFIKATEGIGSTDPQFKRNWKKSREQGVTRGAYHYFNTGKDGKEQAKNFITTVGDLETGDLPPVLDIEVTNGVGNAELQKEIQEWLDVVEEYYKVKPIIYSNVDFYRDHVGSKFDGYPFWAAHYKEQNQPRTARNWIFWQHSEEGHVNGIPSDKVDFNVFNGDVFDFRKLLVNGSAEPVPATPPQQKKPAAKPAP
ncbi:MAG: glycoside hydrolase family 25 protein [Dinghuibacter sp.]|nr:glycoside hydrolase family 25 protein [Dinghuibacter sp.]